MRKHIIRTIPIICLLILALLSTIQNLKPTYTNPDLTTPANTPHNVETKPVSKNTETTIPLSTPAINNAPATESTEPSETNVETTVQKTIVETTACRRNTKREPIYRCKYHWVLDNQCRCHHKGTYCTRFHRDTVDRYPITMNEMPERRLGGEMPTQICGHNRKNK